MFSIFKKKLSRDEFLSTISDIILEEFSDQDNESMEVLSKIGIPEHTSNSELFYLKIFAEHFWISSIVKDSDLQQELQLLVTSVYMDEEVARKYGKPNPELVKKRLEQYFLAAFSPKDSEQQTPFWEVGKIFAGHLGADRDAAAIMIAQGLITSIVIPHAELLSTIQKKYVLQ